MKYYSVLKIRNCNYAKQWINIVMLNKEYKISKNYINGIILV